LKNLSRLALPIALAGLMGCHGHRATDGPAPKRLAPMAPDSLWNLAERAFNHGKWGAAQKQFDLLGPLLTTTDPRYLRMHFFLGEILFAQGNQLQAVREFTSVARGICETYEADTSQQYEMAVASHALAKAHEELRQAVEEFKV